MSDDEPKSTIFVSSMIGPLWDERAAVELLVRKLLDVGGQRSQVADWEWELNVLVHKVYWLKGI